MARLSDKRRLGVGVIINPILWIQEKAAFIGFGAVACLITFSYGWHVGDKRASEKANLAAAKAVLNQVKETNELADKFRQIKVNTDAAQADYDRAIAAFNERLRARASRPNVPNPTRDNAGCSPVQLYREDAEDFGRYAVEARQVDKLLQTCQDERRTLRDAMLRAAGVKR